MQNGPQNVSEATMQVLRQRNAALRNMPSGSQPNMQSSPQAAAPNNLLNKISQNNTPKAQLARQQQAQLAERAAYMAQQRQQMYAYPPQGAPQPQLGPNGQPIYAPQQVINGQPVTRQQVPPPGYGYPQQMQQQQGTPQQMYTNERAPARTRRR
jgi:hypothetical protein